MSRIGYRRLVAVALVTGIGLTGAACSSSDDNKDPGTKASSSTAGTPLDPKTKVSITVDCQPPTTKKAERKQWLDDIAEFNKTYPNVTVNSKDAFPCEDPAKFTAQLQGGSETNTFYTYMTDLQQVLDSVQGPVAKIVAVIIIIVTGLTLAFGETAGGFRRLIQIIFGLSIAFAAMPSSAV